MAFRASARETRTGRVTYGPFPARTARLLGALLAIFIGALSALGALERNRVACTGAGACVVEASQTQQFARARLVGVRMEITTGSKGSKYGVPVLLFDGGAEYRLLRGDVEERRRSVARIDDALRSGAPFDETYEGPRILFAVVAVALIAALSLLWAALKFVGRYDLEIIDGGARLRVQRRLLGLSGAARHLSLENIEDVKVEHGEIPDFWVSRGQTKPPGGRIVIHHRSGERSVVTEPLVLGTAVHLRAASELRALLGLEPRPGGVEEELARLPPIAPSARERFTKSALGAVIGCVLGIVVVGVTAITFGFARIDEDIRPWIIGSGSILGAVVGVAVGLFVTRKRPPL